MMIREHRGLLDELQALVRGMSDYDEARHDDLHLLRFLLSHKMRPIAASKAFGNALRWRSENKIDEISAAIRNGLEQPGFPRYNDIFPKFPAQIFIPPSPVEQPYFFGSAGAADIHGLMQAITPADFVQYTFYINERLFFECDAATRRTGRIVRFVRVVDARGFGVKHFNLQFARANAAAARMSEDAYPQLLGAMFVCNVSTTFKTLWDTTVARLMPKRVLEKTFVLMPLASAKDRQRLLSWIPEEHLPLAVGGSLAIGGRLRV